MLNNKLTPESQVNIEDISYPDSVATQVRSIYTGIMPFANITDLETQPSPLLTATARNLGLDTVSICNSFVDVFTNPLFNNYSLRKEDGKNTTINAFLHDYLAKIGALLNTDLTEKNLHNVVFMRDHVQALIQKNEKYLTDEELVVSANKLRNRVNRTIINTNSQLGHDNQRDTLPLIVDNRNPDTEVIWMHGYGKESPISPSNPNQYNNEVLINKLKTAKQSVNLPSDELPIESTEVEFDELFQKKNLSKLEVNRFVQSINSCRSFNKKLSTDIQTVYDKIKSLRTKTDSVTNEQNPTNTEVEEKRNSIASFIKKIFSRS